MEHYYAIRHKPSGRLLPGLPNGNRAGGTWVELSDETPPRLFRKGQYAASALTHWLQGKKTVRYGRSGDWWFGEDDSRYENVEPAPDRKREDMEIVRVRVEVDHD